MASTSETRVWNDLVTTTLDARKGKLIDNIFQNDVFLSLLKKHALEKIDGGTQITRQVEYAKNDTVGSIGEYDLLDTTPQTTTTSALFPWRQHAGTIVISKKEALLNKGRHQMISLVKQRVNNALAAAANDMSTMLNSDGTGNSNKDFLGLQALVATAPATGTVGGINRANESWWRNRANASLADNPATAANSISFSASGLAYMNELLRLVGRGGGRRLPHVIYTTETIYGFYEAQLEPLHRIDDKDVADLGFESVKFHGIPVVHSEFSPSGLIYFLNFDFLKLVFHPEAMFDVGDPQEPTNQLVVVRKMHTLGNLILDSARKQGCLAGVGA